MKSFFSKMTALLLACLVLLSCLALVGCGNDTPETPDVPDTPADPDAPIDTPEEPVNPNAPEDYIMSIPKQNLAKEFVLMTADGACTEIYIEDEDEAAGDTMDTAKFYRTNRVEEHLGIDVINSPTPGGWANRSQYLTRMMQSNQSGDQDYHMGTCYEAFAAEGAVQGYYYDVNTIDSVDLSDPWYVQGWNDNMIINDRAYLILSDLSLSMWQRMNVLYFNKQLSDQIGVSDTLYQLAEDGDWTVEFMMNCAEQISQEDGNDVWDESDTYGICFNRFNCRAMLTYFDMPLAQMNEDGEYELCLYNDRTEEIFGTMHSYMFDNKYVYMNLVDDGDYTVTRPMFMDNRLLFLPARLQDSQDLRSMEGVFGILPFPKYDADQESYCTHSDDTMTVFFIPSHTLDAEFCGLGMDALSAENKFSVIPSYYDVVLKGRTTKDEQSGRMIDIARDHMKFDFVFGHITAMDFMWTQFGNTVASASSTSYKPTYDTKADTYEAKLGEIMDAYWDVR